MPQRTPTNNTEQAGSGFTRTDDADESFAFLDPSATLPDAPAPDRLDGRWLADALGVDPNVLVRVSGAHGTDQVEAPSHWPTSPAGNDRHRARLSGEGGSGSGLRPDTEVVAYLEHLPRVCTAR